MSENPFGRLIQEIRQYLGPTSGIDSDEIDVEHLKALMAKYTSDPAHWLRYAYADKSRNYTRNAIDDINGKANLVLIVWNPSKGSLIHDHADAHCVMKILKGDLTETVYQKPGPDHKPGSPIDIKKETTYKDDQVAYISDQIGLHRVYNPHSEELAMSLHLYTPPNAAEFGFNVYDQKTGKSCHVPPPPSQ